jgi:competence protein ComEC
VAAEVGAPCAIGALLFALLAAGMALRVAWRRRVGAGDFRSDRGDAPRPDEELARFGIDDPAELRTRHDRVRNSIAFHAVLDRFGELIPATAVLGLAACGAGIACSARSAILDAAHPVVVTPGDGTIVVVEGTVDSLPLERGFATDVLARHFDKPSRHAFQLRDIEIVGDDGSRSRIESPRGARVVVSVSEGAPAIALGERVRVTGRMHGPRGDPLPRTGDPRVFAASRGICATVSVDSPTLVSRLAELDPARAVPATMRQDLEQLRGFLRARVRESLLAGVPDREIPTVRPMLVALVLGESEEGYGMVEGAFRSVGLAHILAISGFNLAVLGWVVGTASRLVTEDRRVHAIAIGVAAATALVLMAPAASAMRSAIMAIIGAIGAASGRDWNGDALLAGAALILLATDPALAGNAGFQLSFGCVLALRHLAEPLRSRWLDWLPRDEYGHAPSPLIGILGEQAGAAVAASVAAFLVSAPLVLLHFGTVQPMGALLTLACAPLSSITLAIAYPKAIIGVAWPPLVAWCGPLLWAPAEMQVSLVERCLELFGGSIPIGAVEPETAVGLLVLTVGGVVLRRRRWRRSCGLLATAIVIGVVWRPASAIGVRGEDAVPRVTMVAVGDGSMHIIEAGSKLALFDAGSSSSGSVGARVLIPWLERHGRRIDLVVLSHPNLDHFSAMVDLSRSIGIGEVVVHRTFIEARAWSQAVEEMLSTLEGLGVRIRSVEEGDAVVVGGLRWDFVWPRPGRRPRAANDCSLVARVELSHEGTVVGRVLFTGDIETEPAALLQRSARRDPSLLACDVMELPHHGSWREAVTGLVEAADPVIVLQSTAMRRFRSDRFADALEGRMRFATCRDGTTEVRFGSDGWIRARTFDGYRWIDAGCWRQRTTRSIDGGAGTEHDRAASHEEAVAGDAVSAVVENEFESARSVRNPRGHRDGTVGGHARDAHAHAIRPELDTDQRVIGCGLENREGGREHRSTITETGGVDRNRLRTEVVKIVESKQVILLSHADAETRTPCSACDTRSVRVIRHEFRERSDPIGFDEDRRNIGREIRGGLAGMHPRQQFVGEEEGQCTILPDRDTSARDHRSVACPRARCRRRHRFRGDERNRCDSGEIDRARRGRGGRRAPHGLHHGLAWLGRLLARTIGLVRIIAQWISGRLVAAVATRSGWRRGGKRIDLDLGADRLDETDDLIAVHEREDIGIVTRLDASATSEPQRADAIHFEGNLADPPMVPLRGATIELESAWDQLTILQDEHPDGLRVGGIARAGEAPGGPSIEIGDDRDGTNDPLPSGDGSAAGIDRNDVPTIRVDASDRPANPASIGDERCDHAVDPALGKPRRTTRESGVGDARRRDGEDRESGRENHRKIHWNHRHRTSGSPRQTSARLRSALLTHRTLLRVGHRPIAVARRVPRNSRPEIDRVRIRHRRRSKRTVVVTILAQRLSLEDRKVPLGHLENDQSHRGAIRVALGVAPRTVWILTRDQFVADRRPPFAPSIATREVHSLHRVIVPVEVVRLRIRRSASGRRARERRVADVVETAVDRVVLVNARVEKARHTSRRPRPARCADVLHVPKSTIRILARPHIGDRVVDRRLRHLDAGVAGRAESHHFANGHRNVRIVRNRVVAPSALIVLAADDQLYGAYERIADPVVVLVHPVDLAEEQRGESVAVHRTVRLVGHEEPGLRRVREDEVERLADAVAEIPATGHVSIGEECDGAQAGDTDVLRETPLSEGSLSLLLPPKVLEAPSNGCFEGRRDLLRSGSVLRAILRLLLRLLRSSVRGLRCVRSLLISRLRRRWCFVCRLCGQMRGSDGSTQGGCQFLDSRRSARPPPIG